ncbi:MAG: GLPGLI family protein [Bacteroidales bacterium]
MKQHIYILIPIIFLSASTFCVFGQNQSFFEPIPHKTLDKTEMIVIYNLEFSPDSTNIQDKFETRAVLYIGNEISLYQCLYSVKREEIMRGAENMDDLRERAMNAPNARFAGRYFKNYPSGKITVTDRVIPDSFIYQEDKNICSWTLHSEISNYKGYSIQKASCSFGGRDWIAWFSTEVSYSDGPHKFSGLPGLILKLYDTRNHYLFEMASVEVAANGHVIEFPERNYIQTTKAQFFQARSHFRENIINRAAEAGLDIESQQTAAENLRRRNNPIELTAD